MRGLIDLPSILWIAGTGYLAPVRLVRGDDRIYRGTANVIKAPLSPTTEGNKECVD